MIRTIALVALLILLIGCVEVQYVPEKEEKIEKTVVAEEQPESEVTYTLINEISGLLYLDPQESVFITLVDTKTDALKKERFEVQKGVLLAHKVEYAFASENNIEFYIVPSYEDFQESNAYYEDCTTLVGECYIPFSAGMVIKNRDDSRAKVQRNIGIYEPSLE
ncbi:hypothetical protein GOV09_01215 [Candidatus Woesearchaeota archaeon]|nr:hypothetical protein [Candidatus Woesearchaeota archaeon]